MTKINMRNHSTYASLKLTPEDAVIRQKIANTYVFLTVKMTVKKTHFDPILTVKNRLF